MQRSAPSTERRRRRAGHTLIEIMIAITIFSIVFGVALQQLRDSTDASTYSTVQADLRRVGQDVLGRIAQDLRSTQAKYVGASTSGDTLELTRVKAYNGSTNTITLETDSGGSQVFIRYRSPLGLNTPDGRYQILQFWRGNATFMAGTTPTSELTRELAPAGFEIKAADATTPFNASGVASSNPFGVGVTGMTLPGSYVSGASFVDEPVLLAVRLTLRRRTGFSLATGETFATVNMQTEVMLRPSSSY